jgi:hypothetical protein
VDILLSSENVSVYGGPASIDVNVDFGAQGTRGSFIFAGPGKPTDPDVDLPPIQPYDLYINEKPSDTEYLFLYQYGSVNGVETWSKVLRLIPNTALANIPVIFYNGQAVTFVPESGVTTRPTDESIGLIIPSPVAPSPAVDGMLWLDVSKTPNELLVYNSAIPFAPWIKLGIIVTGLSFPISDYFPEINLSVDTFNIQYIIRNETPISSGLTLGELTELGSKVYLPVYITASQTGEDLVTWETVTGIKNLNFVVTANIGSLEI